MGLFTEENWKFNPIVSDNEVIKYALYYARRYFPICFRLWPEDAKQTAILGALISKSRDRKEIGSNTKFEMMHLLFELKDRPEKDYFAMLRRCSERMAPSWDAKKLHAKGWKFKDISTKTGLKVDTIRRLVKDCL